MDLSVPYSQANDPNDAYKRALEQITPEYVAKFNIKADIKYDEAGKKITATGKGFTLCLKFADSETQVSLDLGFLLKPFRKTVLEAVERKLSKHV